MEERASTSALAARLGVSEPTVTAMAKRLARLGLLQHTPYYGVSLTPAGEKAALEIIRHHRLLELYLVEALGLSWEKVHAEAEKLEHSLSDELEDRMDAVLGHPTSDPHGHPIPSRDGSISQAPHASLLELAPGALAVVQQVPDRDPDLLRYLGELGLVPRAEVRVIDKAPFGGPLTLEVRGRRRSVGSQLAGLVQVSRPEPAADPGIRRVGTMKTPIEERLKGLLEQAAGAALPVEGDPWAGRAGDGRGHRFPAALGRGGCSARRQPTMVGS